MSRLTLYHTNDMHGCQDLLALLESLDRGGDSLLVDAGDALVGSNTVFRLAEPILERMSRLGYRAMAMGNREFHYLRSVHKRRCAQRSFPMLAANLVDLRGGRPFWERSLELEVGGLRVGLFGATPVQYPVGAVWEKLSGFRFLDPARTLPPIAEELASRNDLVILLSHLGARLDREMAPRLPGVSLIVGGHSHTLFTLPERAGDAWIVQTGSHGRFLGEVRLEPGRTPVGIEYRLLPADGGQALVAGDPS
jgi:5'-nucleotidase